MNRNEAEEVLNILNAAIRQLDQMNDKVSSMDHSMSLYWGRSRQYAANASSVEREFNVFAAKMKEAFLYLRKLLKCLTPVPVWKDYLRTHYRFRINYNLRILTQEVQLIISMNDELRQLVRERSYGYETSLAHWYTEWQQTCGRDLQGRIRQYQTLLKDILEETQKMVRELPADQRQKSRGIPVSHVCPRCGVKNPIGRSKCLRCFQALEA